MASKETLEFDRELHSLLQIKLPVSASKIQSITKLAMKHIKVYKNIVYSIEKFIQKGPSDYKLAGLYVVDSVARAAQKQQPDGENYINRIEEKLEAIFPHLMQASPKDRVFMSARVAQSLF
ncbi:hypothetical protein BJ742DRAFT_816648 [Cladochytrium replicatum]|nr:hypothetical protein BJ742DRAFT_816648 [Cladochytrium replicatum]